MAINVYLLDHRNHPVLSFLKGFELSDDTVGVSCVGISVSPSQQDVRTRIVSLVRNPV